MIDPATAPISCTFRNTLGIEIAVQVKGVNELYDALRMFGAQGWTSGEIPPGGIVLPFAFCDEFDWRIIGARKTKIDNEDVVFHRGLMYKRRDYDEDSKKDMPTAIRFSRGAKPTDPPHIVEGKGDFKYVTLVTFRGNAKPNPAYRVPAA